MVKKIVITGHKGYIGSRLLKRLLSMPELNGSAIHLIDIADGNDVMTAPLPVPADIVFHLAGQAGAVPSMHNPIWDAHANIMTAIRIATTYTPDKAKKVIFTTSGGAKEPASAYGLSKKTAEEYFKLYSKQNTVICRLSSVYGDKPRGVVDTFIKEKKVLNIYGDGSAVRDFVHVDDVVDGLIKSMEWEPGEYEMGSGEGVTIKEIAQATGKPIAYNPSRPGELHTAVLENSTPNWKPKINVLEYVRSKN